jgi:hypothetical protein
MTAVVYCRAADAFVHARADKDANGFERTGLYVLRRGARAAERVGPTGTGVSWEDPLASNREAKVFFLKMGGEPRGYALCLGVGAFDLVSGSEEVIFAREGQESLWISRLLQMTPSGRGILCIVGARPIPNVAPSYSLAQLRIRDGAIRGIRELLSPFG